jgi:pimeloyl-ACP methyl ester carboxylesterase
MQAQACTDLRGCHLIEGAGHWVQQEQPARTATLLIDFLNMRYG